MGNGTQEHTYQMDDKVIIKADPIINIHEDLEGEVFSFAGDMLVISTAKGFIRLHSSRVEPIEDESEDTNG